MYCKKQTKTNIMTTLEIATDLTTTETNTIVTSYDEFMKMVKLVGRDNLYMWAPWNEWVTVDEFANSNDLKDLF